MSSLQQPVSRVGPILRGIAFGALILLILPFTILLSFFPFLSLLYFCFLPQLDSSLSQYESDEEDELDELELDDPGVLGGVVVKEK